MKVKDVMTTDVVTVRPGASLKEVAETLAQRRISGLPVVDDAGVLQGVVSEADILFKEGGQQEHHHVLGWLLEPYGPASQLKLEARTAEEAMTAPAITIAANRPVAEAAEKMLEEKINRLPVVDADDKLIGIVTRADLVRAFIRPDAEIAQEIREDVALRTLWIAPEQIAVTVEHGEVELSGQVETESEAQLLERFASRVPGVVSVDSRLSWENGKRK